MKNNATQRNTWCVPTAPFSHATRAPATDPLYPASELWVTHSLVSYAACITSFKLVHKVKFRVYMITQHNVGFLEKCCVATFFFASTGCFSTPSHNPLQSTPPRP